MFRESSASPDAPWCMAARETSGASLLMPGEPGQRDEVAGSVVAVVAAALPATLAMAF
jgi:hypothetical protein